MKLTPELTQALKPKKKRRKHHNRHVFITPGGEFVGEDHPGPKRKCFDSETEFRRFLVLRDEQAAGLISFLRTQVRYWLHDPGGKRVTSYRADFVYVRNGVLIVEDVKSEHTRKLPRWKMLKRWMLSEHGIAVTEFIEEKKRKRKG